MHEIAPYINLYADSALEFTPTFIIPIENIEISFKLFSYRSQKKMMPLTIEREPWNSYRFPPGFRFHPSDEELIVHYLQNKASSRPLPASIIADIDLYKYNPWELPSMFCNYV